MSEPKPANGVRGFILNTQHYEGLPGRGVVFRVYDGPRGSGVRTFTDYDLGAEDIEVTIHDEEGALVLRTEPHACLDWSDKVLGRRKP